MEHDAEPVLVQIELLLPASAEAATGSAAQRVELIDSPMASSIHCEHSQAS